MVSHEEMIEHLTFEYYCLENPNMSLNEYLSECGIPDRYLIVDTQSAWDYWTEHLCPVADPEDHDDYGEYTEFFDAWLNWLVGSRCLEGNDIDYMYPHDAKAAAKLNELGIRYTIADREEV